MAKNFLAQIFGNSSGYYDSSVYRDEVSTNTKHSSNGLTSVEKYLHKKYGISSVVPGGQTGVAKYLAKKEQKISELTGVDKYLAKTGSIKRKKPTELSGVDKYVSRQKNPSSKVTASIVVKNKKENNPVQQSKIIDLSDAATQCQAATLKGTRCKRKSNLTMVEKTHNKQQYKFAVCNQHDNSEFSPFLELL